MHVLGPQDLNALVATQAGQVFIYFQNNILVIAALCLVVGYHLQAGDIATWRYWL